MLVEVKVPVLAESVANATLLEWYKQAGDRVKRGDNLIDLETDKVTLEVAAPDDGVLVEIRLPNGATANSQDVLAVIDTEAASGAKTTFTPVTPEAPAVPPTATAPKFGPAVEHMLAEHSLKPDAIPTSGRDGRLTKGDVLQFISAAESAAAQTTPTPAIPAPAPTPIIEEPAAAAIAQSSAMTPQTAPPPAPAPRAAEISVTPSSQPPAKAPEERVRMTRLRRATAERLLAAQRDNAILTTFNEVDMQPVLALRDRHQETFNKRHGARLGFMSFFVKAVIAALQRFPVINASVDGEDLVYHRFFDIGIAVGTERGLVVPVLRQADALSFADIETRIADFGVRARDGKLTIEDLTGGTFTITNGGVFGSLLSTPILNPPQSAILGMHKIQQRPMVVDGAIVIRPMMYLALSYDHRIIDGREAVQFLVAVKDQLEDPARMLLQV